MNRAVLVQESFVLEIKRLTVSLLSVLNAGIRLQVYSSDSMYAFF